MPIFQIPVGRIQSHATVRSATDSFRSDSSYSRRIVRPEGEGVRTTAEGNGPTTSSVPLAFIKDGIRSYSDTDRASGGSFSFILPFFAINSPGTKILTINLPVVPYLLPSAGKQRHRRLLLQVLQGPARPGGGQRQQ